MYIYKCTQIIDYVSDTIIVSIILEDAKLPPALQVSTNFSQNKNRSDHSL